MKKIILTLVLIITTIGMFAQKNSPSDADVLKLMNVKRGMNSVNSLADDMSKNMDTKKAITFKKVMDGHKTTLINEALKKFKAEYSAKEIKAIYDECTSDEINYSDLTNNFFKKWRRLKGELFFRYAKEEYSKFK
jgi:hypothetical protein